MAEVGNIGRSDRNQWFVRNVASEGFKLLLIAPATWSTKTGIIMTYRKSVVFTSAMFVGGIALTAAIVFAQASRDPVPSAGRGGSQRLALGDTGTYQLLALTKNGKDELYRINTKTGQVWLYSEYVVLDSNSLGLSGSAKASLDKLIAEASAQGKNVYTVPFWDQTAETRPALYTVH